MSIPIKIAGLGFSVPKAVITNDDLSKILDTSDEWIKTRTGIEKRHVLSGNETVVQFGAEAAQKAVKAANFNVKDIDYIVVATSLGTNIFPSTACEIQSEIGADNAVCFDISAACSGFIYAMEIGRSLIQAESAKSVLIVASEALSRCLDWTDRATCVLFGDGAGAMLMTVSDDNQNDILSIDLKSEGDFNRYIQMRSSGKNCPLVEENTEGDMFIKMEGKEVYKYVVKKLPEFIESNIEKAGIKREEIDYFIPHQANMRIIEALQSRLNIPQEKVIANIQEYANTSAASIPIAMAEAIENSKIKLPSVALLSGFGAGMTAGSAIVRLRESIV